MRAQPDLPQGLVAAAEVDGPTAELRAVLRVLVVDDDQTNRQVIQLLLQRLGCGSRAALGGREAVELACREPFDVILMDVQMPEMDGLEAACRIRRSARRRDVRIVAITAGTARPGQGRWREAGMDGCLCKPIRLEELEDLLSAVVSERGDELRQRSAAAVDDKELARLREITPPRVLESIIRSFLESSRVLLDGLRRSVAGSDSDGLRRAAHALRGKSLAIGASAAAELCARLEELPACADSEAAAHALVDRLGDELERVWVALEHE